MSKYIRYQIKQYLPIIGVILAIFIITFIVDIYLSSNPFGTYFYSKSNNSINYENPLLATSIASLFIPTFIPLFIFSYKYSIKKADTYMQLPFNQNKLRITNYILGFMIILVPFISIFLLSTFITLLIQAGNNPYVITDFSYPNTVVYKEFYYNYGYIFITLIVLIFIMFFEYSMSCIAAYCANNTIDGFIYICLFFVFRLLILYAIPQYFFKITNVNYHYNVINWNITNIPVMGLLFKFFNSCIAYGGYDQNFFISVNYYGGEYINYDNIGLVFSSCTIALLGIISALYMILIKDKNKENYGRKRNESIIDYLLPHLSMLLICFAIYGTTIDVTTAICLIIAYFIFYYCLLASLNKSFKIKKYDLICGGVVSFISLLIFIVFCFTI